MQTKSGIIMTYIVLVTLLVGLIGSMGYAQASRSVIISRNRANFIAVNRFGGRVYRGTRLVNINGRPTYLVHVRSRGMNRRVFINAFTGRIVLVQNVAPRRSFYFRR